MPSLNAGIVASSFVYPTVTGGTITSDATYYYHTFLASGTLTVTGGSVEMQVYLAAAGASGGAGGRGRTTVSASAYRYWSNGGGGGGGGRVSLLTTSTLTPGNYTVALLGSGSLSSITKPDASILVSAASGINGTAGTGTTTATGVSGTGGNSALIVDGVQTTRTGAVGNVAGGNGGGGAGANANGSSPLGGAGYPFPQAAGGTTNYGNGGRAGQGAGTGNLPLGNNWIFFAGTPANGGVNTGDGGRGGWVVANNGNITGGGTGGIGRALFRFTRAQVGG